MASTSVAWTRGNDGSEGYSWGVIRGCSKVSGGCLNCWAETMARRFCGEGQPFEGLITNGHWNDRVRFVTEALEQPLHWRKPRRCFVGSTSDLFHPGFTHEQRAAVFGVMAACPHITFQVLTKRPELALEWYEWIAEQGAMVPSLVGEECPPGASCEAAACTMFANRTTDIDVKSIVCGVHAPWPLPNVHLLVSCEDQRTVDERVPLLLRCPAAVRGVSLEPLLGPVDLTEYLRETRSIHMRGDIAGMIRNKLFHGFEHNGKPVSPKKAEAELRQRLAAGEKYIACCKCADFDPQTGCPEKVTPRLDWVIAGAEQSPRRRPSNLEWYLSLVDQRESAGVPLFNKQVPINGRVSHDPLEWPERLRIRMWPGDKWK